MAIANLVGRTMISAKHIAKAISLAKVMALCKVKSLAKFNEVPYIMNLANIMAWLWYKVGHEEGHEFGSDYGQDIYSLIFGGR